MILYNMNNRMIWKIDGYISYYNIGWNSLCFNGL